MQYYDPEKAARVWGRVQGNTDTVSVGLQGLLTQAIADEKAYIALSRQIPGTAGQILQKLARQEQKHITCLKGICALVRGAAPEIPVTPTQVESVDAALRKCYRNALQSLSAYEGRISDPDYGAVFSILAQEKRQHCLQILSLLGNYSK